MTGHDAGRFQLAEALGEHPPGHARDVSRELHEALRAIQKPDQYLRGPPTVEESKGSGWFG